MQVNVQSLASIVHQGGIATYVSILLIQIVIRDIYTKTEDLY